MKIIIYFDQIVNLVYLVYLVHLVHLVSLVYLVYLLYQEDHRVSLLMAAFHLQKTFSLENLREVYWATYVHHLHL